MQFDVAKAPLGTDKNGKKVYLRDIWPTSREIGAVIRKSINKQMFTAQIRRRVQGRRQLAQDHRAGRAHLQVGRQFHLCAEPALFRRHAAAQPSRSRISSTRASSACSSIRSRPTTSRRPARSRRIRPAGKYLRRPQVQPTDFNQYGTRRGNHEVMMRGTFANIRIKNQMVPGVEGGFTVHYPSRERMTMYDAAMRYKTRERAAGRVRRQGIRHRLVARLGGEGHDPARHPRRGRAIVRAHPPLQPGRHGRRAAGVRGRHLLADARAQGRRTGHDSRPARRSQAASAAAWRRSSPPTAGSSACR